MNALRAILLAVLVVCGCAVTIPAAAAPTPNTPADVTSIQRQQQANNSTVRMNNSTLGAEISSFMQVSTSQAEGSVDTGLWVARFNQTKNKSAQQALVRHRVDDMQKQLSDLRDRKQTLVTKYKNDRISQLRYQSEMSKLVGEISSLQHSIAATHPRAVTVGAQVNELNKLNKQSKTVGGPEAREIAKSMHGVTFDEEDSIPGGDSNNTTQGPGTGTEIGAGNGSLSGNHTVNTNGTVGTGNGSVGVGKGNGRSNGNGNEGGQGH